MPEADAGDKFVCVRCGAGLNEPHTANCPVRLGVMLEARPPLGESWITIKANDIQIGGAHYKGNYTQEHWDYAWERKFDLFQYIITKWVERWRKKGGVEDLKKARHALDKYIELVEKEPKTG